ncbi:MAG: PAS domain S-box protein [Bacteroidetes bacterium]|nr:PAS domain S-box protein [Bacteroidota bacterium]
MHRSSSISSKITSLMNDRERTQVAESIEHYSNAGLSRVTPDLLEMVWDRTQDGMLLTDSDGLIVAVNAAFCGLTGMSEQELVGFPFTVIYDSTTDRKAVFDTYLELVRSQRIPRKYEQELHLNSGHCVEVEIITSTLVDDAQETYVLTEYRDISDRKRWERAMHLSEVRYRSLFENAVLPMYESTIDGKLTNANIAMMQLLGYDSFAELLALNLETDVYVHPEQRMSFLDRIQSGTETRPAELQLKRKDGSTIIVLAHTRILKDENGLVIGFEGVLENIAEQKELEQQVQANIKKLEANREELTRLNAQKDKILAIVSHDLRSPFSSILGFCDLLKSEFTTLTDKEKLEYIGFINEAAMQQLAMVNSILDWSRIETGRINMRVQPLDLRSLVSTVATSMLGLAMKKGIAIRYTVPEETILPADEQLIRRLLLNLVGNALKFTPANGTVSIDVTADTAGQLVMSVSDTGVGIPAEDLGKLFRIEEKYSRQGLQGENGTGLGLPMCYEIMKKHNGTIEAVSEEGRGTSFILTFNKLVRSTCKKVLVVDDQVGNRLIISRFMKRISEGSEIFFAETAKEALTMMATNVPDLIITDYHMPQMNGLEFLRAVRNDERTKNMPVILVSGANLEEHVHTDMMTKILRKPINFNELKGVMQTIQF